MIRSFESNGRGKAEAIPITEFTPGAEEKIELKQGVVEEKKEEVPNLMARERTKTSKRFDSERGI